VTAGSWSPGRVQVVFVGVDLHRRLPSSATDAFPGSGCSIIYVDGVTLTPKTLHLECRFRQKDSDMARIMVSSETLGVRLAFYHRRTRSSRSTPGSARRVKARGHFPTETAALKCIFLALMSLDPTGRGRQQWTNRWKPALNAFTIALPGRIMASPK
jgi:hypothetical protein